jgi:hypothetical protein
MHSSNTCDMYMCRLRHINDSVLSSLKMEGIRLLFLGATSPLCWSNHKIIQQTPEVKTQLYYITDDGNS